MKKNKKKDNSLIKKNKLVGLIREAGIKRVSSECLSLLDKNVKENLGQFLRLLKEEILTHGRETLKKEDITNILGKKKESSWEI